MVRNFENIRFSHIDHISLQKMYGAMILECVFMLCYKFVSFSFEHLNILSDFFCHIGLWMDLKPILVCLERARKKTVHQIQNQILIQGLHCTMLTIEALFQHAKAKLSFQKEK